VNGSGNINRASVARRGTHIVRNYKSSLLVGSLGAFIRLFTRFVFGYWWYCLVGLMPCLYFRLSGSLDRGGNIRLFFLRSRRVASVKNSNEMVS